MNFDHCVPLVEVTRGDIIESIHFGAFIVVDSNGNIIASQGSPRLMTYPRSAIKPFQALPFIELDGDKTFGLSSEEIAIMCASHAGSDLHLAILASIHQKIGTSEDDLACGVHWPGDLAAREALKLAGKKPRQFHHNCSGKHSGMLAHAQLRELALKHYLDPEHPIQITIRETLAEMVGMAPDEMPMGIDGCSAPVYGIPLINMAQAVALLADPASLDMKRAKACRKITAAMMAHPIMVAGSGKFDTDLMAAGKGKIFSKAGAEGYQIIGVLPGVLQSGSPGYGVAIKISDGDYSKGRARTCVALNLLSWLGVLDKKALNELSAYGNVPVKNWRGLTVGEIRPAFSLDALKN